MMSCRKGVNAGQSQGIGIGKKQPKARDKRRDAAAAGPGGSWSGSEIVRRRVGHVTRYHKTPNQIVGKESKTKISYLHRQARDFRGTHGMRRTRTRATDFRASEQDAYMPGGSNPHETIQWCASLTVPSPLSPSLLLLLVMVKAVTEGEEGLR